MTHSVIDSPPASTPPGRSGPSNCEALLYDDVMWAERIPLLLPPDRVLSDAIAATGNSAIHALPPLGGRHQDSVERPAARGTRTGGAEVTDDVFESTRSVVFDQAENRLHTTKAVLVAALGG